MKKFKPHYQHSAENDYIVTFFIGLVVSFVLGMIVMACILL